MRRKIVSFMMAALMTVSAVSISAPVTASAEETAGRTVPHYDIREAGGDWDGTHYYLNGELQKDVFFCDGEFTYYLQKDGTPMTDRLTYHPDGEHVIYFDENGHEVFSNFTNVKKSIAGEAVDDLCFFDTFGYMYVNTVTYDQAGENLYYVNPYGVIERNGWFSFADNLGGVASALGINAGDMGYGNADGTLAVNCTISDASGVDYTLGGNGAVISSVQSLIGSVDSYNAIEADVMLSGSGTGYHAKLVICTSTSAVSFGLQYDSAAVAPYTGKTMVLLENIASNNTGGQTYTRPGNIETTLGEKHHMMITMNQDGTGNLYFDNQLVGSYYNPDLVNSGDIALRVEASGRLNGDQVNAEFSNIKLKKGGVYNAGKAWNTHEFQTNPTIHSTLSNWNHVVFSGYVSGINGDWDSDYGSVSDIIQFF